MQIHLLSLVGGRTVEEATRNIMKKFLATKMALEFTWTGKGHTHQDGQKKKSFNSLKMKEILMGMQETIL